MEKFNNFEALSFEEMKGIDGGIGIVDDIIIGVVGGLVISAIDNWGDIRDGWNDGRNGKPPRH